MAKLTKEDILAYLEEATILDLNDQNYLNPDESGTPLHSYASLSHLMKYVPRLHQSIRPDICSILAFFV